MRHLGTGPCSDVLSSRTVASFHFLYSQPCILFPGSTVWHPDCKQSTKTEEKLRVRKALEPRCQAHLMAFALSLILGAGVWGGMTFCDSFFLYSRPSGKAIWPGKEVPSYIKPIVVFVPNACIGHNKPGLVSQVLRKTFKGKGRPYRCEKRISSSSRSSIWGPPHWVFLVLSP